LKLAIGDADPFSTLKKSVEVKKLHIQIKQYVVLRVAPMYVGQYAALLQHYQHQNQILNQTQHVGGQSPTQSHVPTMKEIYLVKGAVVGDLSVSDRKHLLPYQPRQMQNSQKEQKKYHEQQNGPSESHHVYYFDVPVSVPPGVASSLSGRKSTSASPNTTTTKNPFWKAFNTHNQQQKHSNHPKAEKAHNIHPDTEELDNTLFSDSPLGLGLPSSTPTVDPSSISKYVLEVRYVATATVDLKITEYESVSGSAVNSAPSSAAVSVDQNIHGVTAGVTGLTVRNKTVKMNVDVPLGMRDVDVSDDVVHSEFDMDADKINTEVRDVGVKVDMDKGKNFVNLRKGSVSESEEEDEEDLLQLKIGRKEKVGSLGSVGVGTVKVGGGRSGSLLSGTLKSGLSASLKKMENIVESEKAETGSVKSVTSVGSGGGSLLSQMLKQTTGKGGVDGNSTAEDATKSAESTSSLGSSISSLNQINKVPPASSLLSGSIMTASSHSLHHHHHQPPVPSHTQSYHHQSPYQPAQHHVQRDPHSFQPTPDALAKLITGLLGDIEGSMEGAWELIGHFRIVNPSQNPAPTPFETLLMLDEERLHVLHMVVGRLDEFVRKVFFPNGEGGSSHAGAGGGLTHSPHHPHHPHHPYNHHMSSMNHHGGFNGSTISTSSNSNVVSWPRHREPFNHVVLELEMVLGPSPVGFGGLKRPAWTKQLRHVSRERGVVVGMDNDKREAREKYQEMERGHLVRIMRMMNLDGGGTEIGRDRKEEGKDGGKSDAEMLPLSAGEKLLSLCVDWMESVLDVIETWVRSRGTSAFNLHSSTLTSMPNPSVTSSFGSQSSGSLGRQQQTQIEEAQKMCHEYHLRFLALKQFLENAIMASQEEDEDDEVHNEVGRMESGSRIMMEGTVVRGVAGEGFGEGYRYDMGRMPAPLVLQQQMKEMHAIQRQQQQQQQQEGQTGQVGHVGALGDSGGHNEKADSGISIV
jgi:hypothetical protein